MRKLLKTTAAAIALAAALPAGPAAAKFLGYMNIGGRIDPAAATPSTPAPAPALPALEFEDPFACVPGPTTLGGVEMIGAGDMSGVLCYTQTSALDGQGGFTGQALVMNEWDLAPSPVDNISFFFSSTVTFSSVSLAATPAQEITITSDTGHTHVVTVGSPAVVSLPPGFTGTSITFTSALEVDELIYIDNLAIQP